MIKKEADIELIKTNPINRVFTQYISKNKSKLCYDNNIPIQLIQYNKTSKHSLKTQQINLIENSLGSELNIFFEVSHDFSKKKKTTHTMGIRLLQVLVLTSVYDF